MATLGMERLCYCTFHSIRCIGSVVLKLLSSKYCDIKWNPKITSCRRSREPQANSSARSLSDRLPIYFMQQDLHLVPLLLVALCSSTACSFISTNKFVLDTNYCFTVSVAVGSANERRQSPHHRSLFLSSNSDRCGGGRRQTMHFFWLLG